MKSINAPYGHKSTEEQVELVSIRVSARVSKPKEITLERVESSSAKLERRMVKFKANAAVEETIILKGREHIDNQMYIWSRNYRRV